MSKRPVQEKKLRRLRKALARRPLPAYIDLIDWLKTRGYAQTTGQAEKIILDGRVKSESHTLGIGEDFPIKGGMQDRGAAKVPVVLRYVPASHRDTLRVEGE